MKRLSRYLSFRLSTGAARHVNAGGVLDVTAEYKR
jgi:hypothetical protein